MVSIKKCNDRRIVTLLSGSLWRLTEIAYANLPKTFVRFRNPGYHNLYKSRLQEQIPAIRPSSIPFRLSV
jgi:hypothetical protein